MKTMSLILGAALIVASPASSLFSKAAEIPTDLTQKIKPATIKVLLQERQKSFLLEVKGSYKIFCPHNNILLSSGFSNKRNSIRPTEEGIFWGETMPGTYGIRIVPDNKETTIFVNGIQYKGCLEIYDVGGSLRAINEVDVESYLKSCLATRFFNITEPEVLNALVITARTDAYYHLQQESRSPWHTTAEESSYKGLAITMQHLPLEKAISDTRHAIMLYQGKPFASCWTENSAGKTASFSSVFRKNTPSPKGVTLLGMESERLKSAWSFQMAKNELANLAHLSSVSDISLFSEKESGKVYAVKLGHNTELKTLDFAALQNVVGKSKLKSNDFTVEVSEDSVRFKGYGEGTGVGLCLHSASLMAKQGLDAKRILSEFFADTSIEKLKNVPKKEPLP